MNGETIIGVGVFALLLLWLLKLRGEGGNTVYTNGPSHGPGSLVIPEIRIPKYQIAPDLNGYVKPSNTTLRLLTSPAPCDCACSDEAGSLLSDTVNGVFKTMTDKVNSRLEDYTQAFLDALPDYIKQYTSNPEAAAAARITQAKTVAFGYALTPQVAALKPGDWLSIDGTTYSKNSPGGIDFYNTRGQGYLNPSSGTAKANSLAAGTYRFNMPAITQGGN